MIDYAELRKELYEKFHDAYHKLYVSELQDEIDRLRSALEPFAKEAAHWVTYNDDEPVVEHFPGYEGEMVVGDLRRAFNVLGMKL